MAVAAKTSFYDYTLKTSHERFHTKKRLKDWLNMSFTIKSIIDFIQIKRNFH